MAEGDKYSELILEEAISQFIQGQYDKNISVIEYYAERKDARASAKLGLAFQLGLGLPIDLDKAEYYLTQAASLGSGEAAHNLGTLYATKPEMDQKKRENGLLKPKNLALIQAIMVELAL